MTKPHANEKTANGKGESKGPRKRPAADAVCSAMATPHPEASPANARVIQMVKNPYTVVNHSYVDYSLVPPSDDYVFPTKVEDMEFHQKLHSMLDCSDLSDAICWLWHGRALRIMVPSKFEKMACVEYFGHKRYSSFLYQLGIHGYKQLSAGKDRGAFYSPLLLRGMPHLVKFAPSPKEFRHLTQDPDNEPDFDLIHLIAPLPTDAHFGKPLTIDDILSFCRKEGRSETRVVNELLALLEQKTVD